MNDSAASAARAAAQRFAARYGPSLPAEVETALAEHGDGGRPEQYDAGIVLAAASLIVSIAQFAQSAWASHRSRQCDSGDPGEPDAVVGQVRRELRQKEVTITADTMQIIEFVAAEIKRQDPRPPP